MILDFTTKEKYDISDLRKIMQILRSENGCPWDREQDHHSIRKNFIEETYEAIEAIDQNDMALLREELGDVLLQVLFHATMEEESGTFTFDDVVTDLCNKLIIRHPHVFGDFSVSNSEEVLKNWENIKNQVKGTQSFTETLTAVPSVLPALMRSEKVAHRAAKAGLDYPDAQGAFENLTSKIAEFREAISKNNKTDMEEELGEVLFSCVNVARKLKIDSECALSRSCEKFISRFEKTEKMAKEQGINMESAEPQTLNCLWNEAKNGKSR